MTNSYPELLLLELLPIGIEDMVRRFCVLPLWMATARFVLRMQWGEAPDTIIKFHERFVVQAAYIGAIFAVHVSLFFNAYAHQASDVESKVSPGDTVCDDNINSELTKKQLEETEVSQSGGNVNSMKPQECMEDKKKDRKEEVHPTNKRPYAAKDLHIKWFDYIEKKLFTIYYFYCIVLLRKKRRIFPSLSRPCSSAYELQICSRGALCNFRPIFLFNLLQWPIIRHFC